MQQAHRTNGVNVIVRRAGTQVRLQNPLRVERFGRIDHQLRRRNRDVQAARVLHLHQNLDGILKRGFRKVRSSGERVGLIARERRVVRREQGHAVATSISAAGKATVQDVGVNDLDSRGHGEGQRRCAGFRDFPIKVILLFLAGDDVTQSVHDVVQGILVTLLVRVVSDRRAFSLDGGQTKASGLNQVFPRLVRLLLVEELGKDFRVFPVFLTEPQLYAGP